MNRLEALDRADCAPRCQYTKASGAPCHAPAVRGRDFCIFHDHATRKSPHAQPPVVEDATSLQINLLDVLRGLADHQLDHRTAALMLYGLQVASSNLKRFNEERAPYAGDQKCPQCMAQLALEMLHQTPRQLHEKTLRQSSALATLKPHLQHAGAS